MRFPSTLMLAPLLCSFSLAQEAQHPAPDRSEQPGALPPSLPAGALDQLNVGLLLDQPGDGRIWALTETFKASFGPEGYVFTPFLGSDAPQNYPVRFDLVGASVAGEEVPLGQRQAPQLYGQSVRIPRAGMSEVYHLDELSVEQTFVFDSLPAGGELVLRIAVDSELAMRSDGAGGFLFENERGHVHYGSALALDAGGATRGLEQRMVPGGFEIVVPESFVSEASFPLVVDPVTSSFNVNSDGVNQVDVDVAYDPQNDRYMIVWENAFSVADHDVLTAFYDPSSGLLNSLTGIDTTNARWDCPRVANAYQDQDFLCVSAVGSSIGNRSIFGRTRSAATGALGSQFLIAGGGFNLDYYNPDVGGFGNDTPTSFDFCVVFERTTTVNGPADIVSQGVSSGSLLFGPLVEIAAVSGQDDRNPRISQSSGPIDLLSNQHQYMVVWEREESSTNRDIWARVVDFDNDITGHSRYRAYSFSDALDPDVSMQASNPLLDPDPYYVITFERLVGSDYDIFAVVAQDGDADNARNVTAMQDEAIQDEQSDPRVVFEGNDYLIFYRSESNSGDWDGYFTSINVVSDGSELRTGVGERRTAVTPLNGTTVELALTSNFWDFTAGTSGMALWTVDDGFQDDVRAAFLTEFTPATVGSQYCEAVTNDSGRSAWITARTGQQDPNLFLELTCTELPANQFGQFLAATGNGVTPNPGGSIGNLCLSNSIGRYNAQVANSGPNGILNLTIDPDSIPQPMGTVSAMAGETWYFQCWTRDLFNGSPTSNFSNAIGVSFL